MTDLGLRYKIDNVMEALRQRALTGQETPAPADLTDEQKAQFSAAYDEYLTEIGTLVQDAYGTQFAEPQVVYVTDLGRIFVDKLRAKQYEVIFMGDLDAGS